MLLILLYFKSVLYVRSINKGRQSTNSNRLTNNVESINCKRVLSGFSLAFDMGQTIELGFDLILENTKLLQTCPIVP